MHEAGRIVLTGEVSDTPVIRATLQGLYTATFSLTNTTRRMNRSGAYTDRQKRHNIEGKYHLKQWKDKSSGETKYLTQVLIDRFSFAEPDQLELPIAA